MKFLNLFKIKVTLILFSYIWTQWESLTHKTSIASWKVLCIGLISELVHNLSGIHACNSLNKAFTLCFLVKNLHVTECKSLGYNFAHHMFKSTCKSIQSKYLMSTFIIFKLNVGTFLDLYFQTAIIHMRILNIYLKTLYWKWTQDYLC